MPTGQNKTRSHVERLQRGLVVKWNKRVLVIVTNHSFNTVEFHGRLTPCLSVDLMAWPLRLDQPWHEFP